MQVHLATLTFRVVNVLLTLCPNIIRNWSVSFLLLYCCWRNSVHSIMFGVVWMILEEGALWRHCCSNLTSWKVVGSHTYLSSRITLASAVQLLSLLLTWRLLGDVCWPFSTLVVVTVSSLRKRIILFCETDLWDPVYTACQSWRNICSHFGFCAEYICLYSGKSCRTAYPPFLCQTILCSCPVVNRDVSGCYSSSWEACPSVILLSPLRQMWSVLNVHHSTKNCSAVQVEFMQEVHLFIVHLYTLHCGMLMSVSSGNYVHFYCSPFCDWHHDILQDTVASILSFFCETTLKLFELSPRFPVSWNLWRECTSASALLHNLTMHHFLWTDFLVLWNALIITSPGHGAINSQMLRHLSPIHLVILLNIYAQIWFEGAFPSEQGRHLWSLH